MELVSEYYGNCGCHRDTEGDFNLQLEAFKENTLNWRSHWLALV